MRDDYKKIIRMGLFGDEVRKEYTAEISLGDNDKIYSVMETGPFTFNYCYPLLYCSFDSVSVNDSTPKFEFN